MIKSLQLNHLKWGIPVLMLLFLIVLPRTMQFQTAPGELSIGILLDLLVTIPIIYYLLIRKTNIPKFTVVYPFLWGIGIAGFLIPVEHQTLLSNIKVIAIPLFEIGIVSLLLYKVWSLNKSFSKTEGHDFYDKLLIACQEVFPNRIGKILATEIAVIYYLFAPGKKQEKSALEFTYYKKSGILTILAVFLFLVAIETFVVHFVVSKWSVNVAWVLTFLGVYTMLQVLAIIRSMSKRSITINQKNSTLNLRYGFGSQTSIPLHTILKVEKTRSTSNEKTNVCLSVFDLIDSNNVTIHLSEENTLQKIYGIEKKYTSISLFVDELDLFVEEVERLNNLEEF